MQFYTDPARESDPPNAEVFLVEKVGPCSLAGEPGYYWWSCLPGCLPDGDPIGPFLTKAEAIQNAQEN